jgi:hypothetical protein
MLDLGAGNHLMIQHARRLAEIIAAGFAAYDDAARQKAAAPPGAEECPGCGKPILWRSLIPEGTWLAVDAAPTRNGTVMLTRDGMFAEMLAALGGQEPTRPVYEPHVGKCAWMREGQRRYHGPRQEETT